MNSIYPVGSLYFGTQSTCPLQSAGIGTWTRIATNFVTGSTAPVIGNGKTLGLTNGTNLGGLATTLTSNWTLNVNEQAYNVNVTGNNPGDYTKAAGMFGITTDPEKSGIVADLPTYTVNVWRRTA